MTQPHRLPIDRPKQSIQYPAELPQDTRAPAWFYDCFHEGHHDLSIYEIEWAYAAYLRLCPDLPGNKKPDFEIGAV